MAEENKETTFGPQPQEFGQDATGALSAPSTTEQGESTGVENVRYDTVTSKGMPANPVSASDGVESGVTNASGAVTISQEEQMRMDAIAGSDRKIKTLQDVIDRLEQPETEEQRKKRERREKSRKIISAVGDGLQALGNLFFTSQYAPNMYNHEKSSQLNAQNAAIEKARKDREANEDKYLRFALSLGDAENERAKTIRELEAEQERRKLAKEKAKREEDAANRAAVLFPDQQREQKGKADKAGFDAQTAEAKAGKAEELAQAEVDAKRAQAGSYEASAANSYASAAAHNRSNVSEFSAWDEHGKEHKFHTKEAAVAYAKQHGTWKEEDVSETTSTDKTDVRGKKSSASQTKTKKGGHAGKPSPTGGKKSPTA